MDIGDLVVSRRGRDRDRLMLVVGREQELLLLADGKLRRTEAPKKKKPKHVHWIGRLEGHVPDKLRDGQRVSNSEIRRALTDSRVNLEEVTSG